jgi:hypothetical protein
MKITLEKVLVLLIIVLTSVSIVFVLTTKKQKEGENLNYRVLFNATNASLTDIIQDKAIQITTERPLNRTTSNYYNSSFLWERKFVKFGNLTVLDVEVYYFDNSSERSRVMDRFVRENTNRFFVNIENSMIDGWSATLFDFRSIIDGSINGWGAILEKNEKAIYFISHYPIEKNEKEGVLKWIIRRF